MTAKSKQHPIIAAARECGNDNLFYEHLLGILTASTDPLRGEDIPADVVKWTDVEIDRLIAAADGHSDEQCRIKLVSMLSPHKDRVIQMALDDLLPKKA